MTGASAPPPRASRAAVARRARQAWARLRGGELTPWRAAGSVAVGLAIGVTPLWGAHIFLVLAVCVPLRLDAPLSYLAANVSIPPIAPFLTFAELEIGAYAVTGVPLAMDLATVKAGGAMQFVRELAVGTAIFSPAVAAVGGALTYGFARMRRRAPASDESDEGAFDAGLDRTAARYGASRFAQGYVRGKLSSDPVARAVARLAAHAPLGTVLDAGCGRGQLAVLLLELGLADRVFGFDWDAKKVLLATRAARGLAATFREADLRAPFAETVDTGLLIDVLHYLTDDEQDAVLRNVARAARRTVFVRELDPDRGWRSRVTRVQEIVTTALGVNRGARVRIRPISAIVAVLVAEGFEAEVAPCWGGTPFANVLIVARRRDALAGSRS